MRHCTYIVLALSLAGCQSAPSNAPPIPPQPIVITKEVQVPIPVPCVQQVPVAISPRPKPDAKLLTPNADGAWWAIAWLKVWAADLMAENAKLRATLGGCVGPSMPTG